MIELGQLIKEKRTELLLEISDVSSALRIKQEYIAAIEEGNPDLFSSKAYYFGYLKQYLKFLQIDISVNLQPSFQNQKLEINIPASDTFNPNVFFMLIALVFSIIIYNISNSFISKEAVNPIALEIENKSTYFVDLTNRSNSKNLGNVDIYPQR